MDLSIVILYKKRGVLLSVNNLSFYWAILLCKLSNSFRAGLCKVWKAVINIG